ncbi:MAG TPA: ABC transporter permease [Candidatus Acidoferrales bacterium]|nr:ABC transporter permease [Candidatus Acidoferrales bacterium]
MALEALRANKMKAALTMLGVVIGSACIVMVSTVAVTGKTYILSLIEAVGSNLVTAEVMRAGIGQKAVQSDELTMADLEAIRNGIVGLREVAGSYQIGMSVVVNGVERAVAVTGVTAGFQRIRSLVVLRGRFLDAEDMEARTKVCVLSEQLAARAFAGQDAVGKLLRVGELQFTVVGVFKERMATFGLSEIQTETVIIPLPLLKYYSGNEFIRVIYTQASSLEDVPGVTRQVAQILKSRHRPGAVYKVENLNAILDMARKISLALTVVLLLVGFIALIISGVGIMNIMLVTVTERTREIGVRMAVGAPRREIRWQFLLEALIISGTGALAGILIAVSIPVVLRPLLPEGFPVSVSWISVIVAFLVTCLTGVLFGYLPANRAAGLHPTESLRYE